MVKNNYNSNSTGASSPGSSLSDPKEVGPNCSLELPGFGGDGEVPVSNFSFSEEAETSEVQYTTGFHQSIAVTGVTYSGSFEVPGNASKIRKAGWENGQPSAGKTSLPIHISTMTFTDDAGSYTFHNVLLNSHSKDVPADDRTTTSFDFMAERVVEN